MNRDSPFVSVIIPIRNEEQFIAQCLRSVLDQDYPKDRMEVLVVDGGSEDRS
jgi:glycosyltransferase involved in cell wall biosynthesis